jgi:hypothetical protein
MNNLTRQTKSNQESKSDASGIREAHSMIKKRFEGYSGDEIVYLQKRVLNPLLHMSTHLLKGEMTFGQFLFWMERAFDDAYLEYRKMHE